MTTAAPTSDRPAIDFDEAIEMAMSLADFERSRHFPGHSGWHIERMMMLSERLGGVQDATPTVHVAGTKGKGSVSALIASILTRAGFRVGFYSSPHLHSVRERIRVGLEPVSKSEYAALVAKVWDAVQDTGREGGYGGVSFFEMMTAMALVHFRDIRADFQVLEVGLGGRLDATNIVTPEVSVITSISMDHVATLGDTIAKIAGEKAGIIKPGVPCVIAPQPSADAADVFRRTAAERASPITLVQDEFEWERTAQDLGGQSFILRRRRDGEERRLWTPLLGDYQLENAAAAVAAAETLSANGRDIPEDAIESGVREVKWSGRFQVFERDGKTIIVDGAHNPYSMRRLVESLRQHADRDADPDRVILLFGSLGGHSAGGMLDALAALEPTAAIAVQTRHPRSARAEATANLMRERGLKLAAQFDTVSAGLERALEMAGTDDLILCAGSLAVAGEAIEALEGLEPEIYENLRGPVHREV